MISNRTLILVLGATFLGGLLAGPGLDRAIVQIPAWRNLGPKAWAEFTRSADLGIGLMWYPAEGLGALVLTVAASISIYKDVGAPRAAMLWAFGAAGLAILALIVTGIVIVPNTRAVKGLSGTDGWQAAFDRLASWWRLKALLHVTTFAANLCTLVSLLIAHLRGQS
jgi:hypothetical protein